MEETKSPSNYLPWLVAPALGLMAAVGGSAAYRTWLQWKLKRATQIGSMDGVEALQKLSLDSTEQWILVRGRKRTNPVLLFLHGGPGMPLMPFRAVHAPLEEHFVIVHWDQRGAGKSYQASLPSSSMNVEQLLADAKDLVGYLREHLNVEKIYLAGHSSGSMLGILLAARHPEWFHAYIGISQIVDLVASSQNAWTLTLEAARRANNEKAVAELSGLGAPPWDHRQMLTHRKWAQRFGGQIHQANADRFFLQHLLPSPEYSVGDLLRLSQGVEFSAAHLWEKLQPLSIGAEVTRLEVPCYFIAGRHDSIVPQALTADFVEKLQAPQGKELVWFEHSAHWPQLEEPEKFHQALMRFRK